MRFLVILTFFAISCSSGHSRNQPGCPSETLIRHIHDAAFHFQHGPVEEGNVHLEKAQKLAKNTGRSEVQELLTKLIVISKRIAANPNWAQMETEDIRLFLTEWKCLPEETHRRFHHTLPPYP